MAFSVKDIYDQVFDNECHYRYHVDNFKGKEGHEVPVVLDSNTIIDPWAMVIKPLDALITCKAMPGPWITNDLTMRTNLTGVDQLDEELIEKIIR